jgi:ubiquinone/menaquinone biosynthesis C-methylase UbiE
MIRIIMDEIRKEMRSRWNTNGWNYDSAEAHGVNDPVERAQWKNMLAFLPKETQVLDVGAGTGFVALIAAEIGLDVTAFDWSETMLGQAKKKAAAKNLIIKFEQGNMENLPFVYIPVPESHESNKIEPADQKKRSALPER